MLILRCIFGQTEGENRPKNAYEQIVEKGVCAGKTAGFERVETGSNWVITCPRAGDRPATVDKAKLIPRSLTISGRTSYAHGRPSAAVEKPPQRPIKRRFPVVSNMWIIVYKAAILENQTGAEYSFPLMHRPSSSSSF